MDGFEMGLRWIKDGVRFAQLGLFGSDVLRPQFKAGSAAATTNASFAVKL